MTTTTLGTSNMRGGPSRLTRTNPARATKGLGSTLLRQNSLVSNSGLPVTTSSNAVAAHISDPPEIYPAITHFADAIAALPREYRRHTSLLKEVDAKAWGPEENLQHMLELCLSESSTNTGTVDCVVDSATAEDNVNTSEVNSVAGASFDNASLASARSIDPVVLHRRRQYHALRQNLMAIMVTMDEKNHVINNANEEISRHIRRLDTIWPHINAEISDEARLGSLKHWAYTETNPVKKSAAPTTRREAAAASLASLHDSEAAHRSQDRRDAVRRHRNAGQHVDSDLDETRAPVRKTTANGKKRMAETLPEQLAGALPVAPVGRRKKSEKSALGGLGIDQLTSSGIGARPMSRENSQQENTKKRKASATVTTVARKRMNAANQDSPKLASSPLAGAMGKEAYKRSPALSSVRPAMGRGRQNSTNTVDSLKGGRPASTTSTRNGNNAAANTSKSNGASSRGRTGSGKDMTHEDLTRAIAALPDDHPLKVGEREAEEAEAQRALSRSSVSKRDTQEISNKSAASSRPSALQMNDLKSERSARGRASKTSTPVVGTFSEADAAETGSVHGNGSKPKRPPRQRFKDHGLHDSLSPKGLPMKRPHKKSGSLSFPSQTSFTSQTQRTRESTDPPTKSSTPSEREVFGEKTTSINNKVEHLLPAEDEEEDEGPAEDDEERYCYCQGVSYGEMVACDNDECPRQWFHLECIGLKSVPKSAKWFCEECKDVIANGGGNGNSTGTGARRIGNGHGAGK